MIFPVKGRAVRLPSDFLSPSFVRFAATAALTKLSSPLAVKCRLPMSCHRF